MIYGIQQLPGSVWGGIWIAGWVALLLYGIIVLLGLAMVQRRAVWLTGALGILAFLGMGHAVQELGQMQQRQISLYHISRQSLLDFFDGQALTGLSDSLNDKQLLFAAQSNRWACGQRESRYASLSGDSAFTATNLLYDPPFVQFCHLKMAVITDEKWLGKGAPPVAVDVLLLARNPGVSIGRCMAQFPAQLVVFDASNSWKNTNRWRTECAAAGIAYHDVRERGAWVWKE